MSYIGNQPSQVAFVTDQFTGDGTTTQFTMSVAPANTASVLVSITGVLQDPSAYAVTGNTLTFSAAPPTGASNISVRYLGVPASGVTTTAYRTITEFTATAGQTTFNIPSYTVGYINVFRNGVRLGTADFTASNGTSVILQKATNLNDLVVCESFFISSVLNAIPNSPAAVQANNLASGAVVSNLGFTPINKAGDTITGALNESQGADIASADNINLTTATGNYVNVTGTTAITSITLAQGAERTVKFAGALTLTNGASLILPSGANITTATGDVAVFRGEAAGVVRCVSYMKANGQAVSAPTLATVATTGSYTDLTNKPTIGTGTVTSITAGAGLTGGTITGTGTVALDVSLGGIGSIFIGISTSYYNSTATYRSVGSVTVAGSTLRQWTQGIQGGGITTSTLQVAPGFGGTWRNDTQFYQFPACCGSPGGAGQSIWRRIA